MKLGLTEGYKSEGVSENGAEENVWIYDRENRIKLEKTAQLQIS
jgi:hypothetical protein